MMISDPQICPPDHDIDYVAVIAAALEQKFANDALRIAEVQAACASSESVASWLAIVAYLRD